MALNTTEKVLGPLEKITMFSVVMIFAFIQRILGPRGDQPTGAGLGARLIAPIFDWSNRLYALLARADAAIMPTSLATVILFEAQKES